VGSPAAAGQLDALDLDRSRRILRVRQRRRYGAPTWTHLRLGRGVRSFLPSGNSEAAAIMRRSTAKWNRPRFQASGLKLRRPPRPRTALKPGDQARRLSEGLITTATAQHAGMADRAHRDPWGRGREDRADRAVKRLDRRNAGPARSGLLQALSCRRVPLPVLALPPLRGYESPLPSTPVCGLGLSLTHQPSGREASLRRALFSTPSRHLSSELVRQRRRSIPGGRTAIKGCPGQADSTGWRIVRMAWIQPVFSRKRSPPGPAAH